ncbi:MAG: hypothetical protein ACYCO0_02835, partial [Candidatus Micrarchaeaceae archaeon]
MQNILTRRFKAILLLFGIVGLAIAMTYLPPRYSLAGLQALNNSTKGILNYIYCVGDSGHGGQNLTYYAPILASH